MMFKNILLSAGAVDVMGQLFVCGPTWDGNLLSKDGRTELIKLGFADKTNGWNFLTKDGIVLATTIEISDRNIPLKKDWQQKLRC